MTGLIFHPLARRELLEAARYYETERPGLGRHFREAVEAAITRVRRLPHLGRRVSETSRRVLIKGYPYGLVYTPEDEGIVIYAVMHLSREPNYWRQRTGE